MQMCLLETDDSSNLRENKDTPHMKYYGLKGQVSPPMYACKTSPLALLISVFA